MDLLLKGIDKVLGDATEGEYTTIDSTNGIRMYGNALLRVQLNNTGELYLGDQSNEHIKLTATALQFKDGATVYGQLTGGALEIGDGANEYFKYVSGTGISVSTAQANAITIKSGGNINLEAGGDLIMISNTTNPARIESRTQSGKYVEIYPEEWSKAGTYYLYYRVQPGDADHESYLYFGNTNRLYKEIYLFPYSFLAFQDDSSHALIFDMYNQRVKPGPTNTWNLGTSDNLWNQGWFNDYVIALGGINVGNTADPGTGNLLVDQSIFLNTTGSARLDAETNADLRIYFKLSTFNEIQSINIAGTAYRAFGASAFNQRCAQEAKRDIEQLSDEQLSSRLCEIDAMPVYSYRYKYPEEITSSQKAKGILGHNRGERVFCGIVDIPEKIKSDDGEGISLGEYCDYLLVGLKGLIKENDFLKAEIARLEGLISDN